MTTEDSYAPMHWGAIPSGWATINTAPTHGKPILVGFQGQFGWIYFIANADGAKSRTNGYAPPTHWANLLPPPEGVRFTPRKYGE